jgi:autotransporter-associated beta strand protein
MAAAAPTKLPTMNSRRASSVLAAIALSLLAIAAAASPASAQQKPNIIMLFADDAGYADFGFQNQLTGQTTEFKTPNLDALAAQSRLFSNAYVSSSVCAASRAGLLTGRYGQRFGMEQNIANSNDPNDGIPTSEVMMSEALKAAGYRTGVFGKWHIGAETAKQPQNQGFDEFYGILGGGRPYFGASGGTVFRGTTAVQWQNESSFNNIPPDPVLGRNFTDAIGDEASKFVANNANKAQPFFMYVPFTAPHSPYDLAKQQDLAQFDGSSMNPYRKVVAANTLSMDRAIGNIMARVNDPNGDGDTSDSIANNTIIVFTNDNGGEQANSLSGNQMVMDNTPLFSWKGTGWEGGIRVPAMIKVPGVAAGVSNDMISTLDMMPTFLAAAGAQIPGNLDGANLLPYLNGQASGPIHQSLIWRGNTAYWAIRRGDYKLVRGSNNAYFQMYKLNPNGSGDAPGSLILNNSMPDLYRSMVNEFVNWEATMQKQSQSASFTANRFDAFRFRQDAATTSNWNDSGAWLNDADPVTPVTMLRQDSYANAVLVFQPRNTDSYTTNNNMARASGLDYTLYPTTTAPNGLREFMLNELRFNGQFSGGSNLSGTLTGYPLMFVKNLSGGGAVMRLDNTSNVPSKFAFNVNMDVVLHASLEITGNSNQTFAINGQIRDFDEARSVTKTGTSTITFSGNNTYKGATIVNGGTLRIEGASAALANTATVQIGAQGTLVLAQGTIRAPSMQIAATGAFNFTGGVLETANVAGNLTNSGGTFKPGLSAAATFISGNFAQTAGTTIFEIGGVTPGVQYDRLVAGDDVMLGGAAQVTLVNLGGGTFSPALGDTFEIIRATDVLTGQFSSVTAPVLSGGRKWAIQYTSQSVLLQVVTGLSADFDGNNRVDRADMLMWRSAFGVSAAGDANGDGRTDAADYLIWQRQNGTQVVSSSVVASAVPEPAAAALAAVAAGALCRRRLICRRSASRPHCGMRPMRR